MKYRRETKTEQIRQEHNHYLELVKECETIGCVPVYASDYVPLWEKELLTIKEASVYFGIGRNRLYKMANDQDCKFVLFVGQKILIKREILEQYLESSTTYSI